MKISISRETLQKALRAVSGVVDRKQQQNPVLSNVFISVREKTMKLVTTDQEIELRAVVPVDEVAREGEVLISCHKLNDICRVLSDEEKITIDCSADKSFIQAGKSKFVLSLLAAEGFPKIENLLQQHDFSVSRIQLITLMEKTSFAMAEDDVRHFLNGMLLEVDKKRLKAVAADGHRLATHTIPLAEGSTCEAKILIPRKGVLEILHALKGSPAESVSVSFGSSHVKFVCGDLAVTAVLLAHKYPDYEKIIPSKGDKIMLGSRMSLKEAIYRASALLTERFKGIRLRFNKGSMKIFAYNAAKDEAEEDVFVDFNGEEIEMGFNAKYLLDFLSSVNSENIKMTFSEPNGSALLEEVSDNGCKCVLMPMRT